MFKLHYVILNPAQSINSLSEHHKNILCTNFYAN